NLVINGNFTNNGVIYGTISVGGPTINLGTLTGLIGEKGAVGIFKSNVGNANPYVGGFVAAPTLADVTATGFKAAARTGSDGQTPLPILDAGSPNTTTANSVHFIEGGGTGSDFANATAGNSLLLAHESAVGDKGGVAFTYGNSATGVNNYHVGLLSNTNVGPLLNKTVDGEWVGSVQGILEGAISASKEIKFEVNFTQNSFVTSTQSTAPELSAAFGTISVGGKFTANGVVYGTVDFTGGSTNTGQGTLTGLIGQDALIGAFTGAGDASNKPYVGGFTASSPGNTAPPTEAVDCTDAVGATPFDESCDDPTEADLQTRLCIANTSLLITNFNVHCVDNERVTGLVCNDNGIRANPFNAAICGSFDGKKKSFSQNCDTESTGSALNGANCDTADLSDNVCLSSGPYANPFASFCGGTDRRSDTGTSIADVRQIALTTCTNDSSLNTDNDICQNTLSFRTRLSTTDCVVGQPAKLFAAGCDYMQFKSVEVDYCAAAGNANAWKVICNGVVDIDDRVKIARDNACLDAVGAAPNTDCATRTSVVSICTTDPFTRTGCDNVGTITTLRTNYCLADATLWNERCDAGEASYLGVTTKRDNAGLNASENNAPHNDCLTRANVVSTCTT
ncbi:MAG: hypothetical protein K8953_14020, partial [Proteobacteria bacterium]|nr:hypothetical protein [Pseudomonadota bacterium]